MRLSADLCQAHDDVFIRGIIVVPITSSTASAEISATYKAPRVLQNRPGQLYICFGVYVQGEPGGGGKDHERRTPTAVSVETRL